MFCNLLKILSVFALITTSMAYFERDCKEIEEYIKSLDKESNLYSYI